MSGYVLSADAACDLDEIWDCIAEDKIEAADRWIGKLFDTFEMLARMPQRGHSRVDLTDYGNVSFWPAGAYLIMYRTQISYEPPRRDFIEIVAVTQGSRDIPTFFSKSTQPLCRGL